jgi:hypothetical protein
MKVRGGRTIVESYFLYRRTILTVFAAIFFLCLFDGCSRERAKLASPLPSAIAQYLKGVHSFNTLVALVDSITLQSSDSSDIQFLSSVAVSPSGLIGVSDVGRNQILLFSHQGAFVASVGEKGSGPGQMLQPRGVSFDRSGDILAADHGNARVNIYDPSGKFSHDFRLKAGAPLAVIEDSSSYFVVTSSLVETGTIQKYSQDGQFLSSFGRSPQILRKIGIPINGGSIALGDHDILYYVHPADYDLQIFDVQGNLLREVVNPTGSFRSPTQPPKAITPSAIDAWNRSWDIIKALVYTKPGVLLLTYQDRSQSADTISNVIDVFDGAGNFLTGGIRTDFLPMCSDTNGLIYAFKQTPGSLLSAKNPTVYVFRLCPLPGGNKP